VRQAVGVVVAVGLFVSGSLTGMAWSAAWSEGPGTGITASAARSGVASAARSDPGSARPAGAQAREAEAARGAPSPTVPPWAPDDLDIFWEALRIVEHRYVGRDAVPDRDLVQGAVRGLVEALGDTGHTVYLTPDEVRAEREALDGRVTGIGVMVDDRAGVPLIVAVIDGSPADQAGLRAGDLIVAVDGERVERLAPRELMSRVRGPRGSALQVTIEREGAAEPLEVEIVREEIIVPAASWAMVPGTRSAVIRLVQFSSGAAVAVRDAVAEALAAGATGLVLDLRGNPGGLVDEATGVAGAFIEEGVAYRQEDAEGRVHEVSVRGRAVAPETPLVVLVDYGSASAAEIVAGALRDNGRALIVGQPTYGTGTILNAFELADGSEIRLGVARWLTPAGLSAFRVGIEPDEEVALRPGAAALEPGELLEMTSAEFAADGDLQLQRAAALLRRDERQTAGISRSG
jgi:carboxyl-terminal processing protease